MKMNYIRIPNFDNFQAYHDGRRITWIKLLIEIIERFDVQGREKKFYGLPDQSKLTFILLLCLRSHYADKIPFPSEKWIKDRLGLERVLLNPLVNTGFITIDTDSVQSCTSPYRNVPEREKEKEIEREKEKENDIESIFEFWNSQKENGRWKSHTKLTPDIRNAIVENLKTWPAEEINQAVGNFAKVLQGKEFLWTYDKWGLREFLTRHERDNRTALQWWRFHPNHFREDDWLTDTARQQRIKKQRDQEFRQRAMLAYLQEHQAWILEADPAVLVQRCQGDPRLTYAVKKLRPDVIPEQP